MGCRETMGGRLDRLVELAGKTYVRLQVLPFVKGAHAAPDGAFTVLEMGDGERLSYSETPGSGRVRAGPWKWNNAFFDSECCVHWLSPQTNPLTSSPDTRRHTAVALIPSNRSKSGYSGNQGGDCVEVADTSHHVHVRDTRNRSLGHLTFSPSAWTTLLSALREDPTTLWPPVAGPRRSVLVPSHRPDLHHRTPFCGYCR